VSVLGPEGTAAATALGSGAIAAASGHEDPDAVMAGAYAEALTGMGVGGAMGYISGTYSRSGIEVIPYKKGMEMGGGYKLYGSKSTAILEQPIDDVTKIQIHHHNLGPGAIDVYPSTLEVDSITGKTRPNSRLILDWEEYYYGKKR
ncbi:hypothetical protein HZB01_01975, partial [Candidatus Woesearchaeota archaeon]|nr:hypothetical protein [Candidatus Woesearchaeota archaeon]